MDFIEFLFKLILKFVPIGEKDYKSMYQDAQEWKLSLKEDSDNKIEALYSKYASEWYVKMLFAVLYIPSVRWVMDFMNPEKDELEEK